MPADWRPCQGLDDNARVAITEWAWRAYRRAGKPEEAEKLLATITEAMKVTDNQSYYRTLLLYKGLRTEVDTPPDANAVATVSYGLGLWYWLAGRKDQACAAWQRAVSGENWSAFGFIAAEADLGRGLCKPAKKR
jgi:tetratricopeptide (TPR) repeat protein